VCCIRRRCVAVAEDARRIPLLCGVVWCGVVWCGVVWCGVVWCGVVWCVVVWCVQSTVWPEVDKLYGHLNEIVCLAASSDGLFLASACKVGPLSWRRCVHWWCGHAVGSSPTMTGPRRARGAHHRLGCTHDEEAADAGGSHAHHLEAGVLTQLPVRLRLHVCRCLGSSPSCARVLTRV
jgi:hypothetical protein